MSDFNEHNGLPFPDRDARHPAPRKMTQRATPGQVPAQPLTSPSVSPAVSSVPTATPLVRSSTSNGHHLYNTALRRLGTRFPDEWDLPSAIVMRLGTERIGPQRPIIEAGQMLLILHRVPKHEGDRQGVYVWVRGTDDWKFYREGEPYDSYANGRAMLEEHLREYEEAEQQLSRKAHSARKAGTYLRILQEVATKRHAARNSHLALQEAREGIAVGQLDYDIHMINMRDWAYGIERDFDLLYQDTQNALEYREASQAEWLNLLVAIFFPLTIATSIMETGLIDTFLERSLELDRLITISCVLLGTLFIGLGLYVISSAQKR